MAACWAEAAGGKAAASMAATGVAVAELARCPPLPSAHHERARWLDEFPVTCDGQGDLSASSSLEGFRVRPGGVLVLRSDAQSVEPEFQQTATFLWRLCRFFFFKFINFERGERETACEQGRVRAGESRAGSVLSAQSPTRGLDL